MDIENKKVLVVDDVEVNRIILEEKLNSLGANVTASDSVDDALKHLVTSSFDVAFVDLQLGDSSGELIVSNLKKVGLKVPIVAWTAEPNNKRYLDRGFIDVLNKPLENANLYSVLKSVFPMFDSGSESLTECNYIENGEYEGISLKIIELINERREDLPTEMYRIRRAVDLGNWSKAESLIHKLIGYTGTLGFLNFSNKLREAEKLIKQRKVGNCVRLLDSISESAMDIAIAPIDQL
jgi:CheY-like chemotaxis protein